MLGIIKKIRKAFKKPQKDVLYDVQWYPTSNNCIKFRENQAKPAQMPPLMVRKAGWRK